MSSTRLVYFLSTIVFLMLVVYTFTTRDVAPPVSRAKLLLRERSLPREPEPSESVVDARGAVDEPPIHILMTYCLDEGLDRTEFGLTSLRSILAARSMGATPRRRYVIHLIVDVWTKWLITNNSSDPLPHGKHMPKAPLAAFWEWCEWSRGVHQAGFSVWTVVSIRVRQVRGHFRAH